MANTSSNVTDGAVVDATVEETRAENIGCAHRLAAIAELYDRRHIPVEDVSARELWRIDPWEAVAPEIAAAQRLIDQTAGRLHPIEPLIPEPRIARP